MGVIVVVVVARDPFKRGLRVRPSLKYTFVIRSMLGMLDVFSLAYLFPVRLAVRVPVVHVLAVGTGM